MPYITDTEFKALKNEISETKAQVSRITDTLKYTKGNPIIQGYAGKKLDLNDNLDVIELLKKIKNQVKTNDAGDITITEGALVLFPWKIEVGVDDDGNNNSLMIKKWIGFTWVQQTSYTLT
jgi:hypothetical protein